MMTNNDFHTAGRQTNTGRILSMIAICGLLGFFLTGCAAMRARENMQTERLLSAAGFQMRFADTPEKIDNLESLQQRKLLPQNHDGKMYYVYADKTCGCLYVGTENAYQRYEQLAEQRKIARENLEAARAYQESELNWDTWGPWGPWW